MFDWILRLFSPGPQDVELAFGVPRSAGWRAAARAHLTVHPACAACGARKGVVPHHVKPFHLFPECELDLDNLITLCPRCHLLIGHLNDFRSFNPAVREDAALWAAKILGRPRVC